MNFELETYTQRHTHACIHAPTFHIIIIHVLFLLITLAVTLPAPSWLRPTINVPNSIVPCYVAMDNFTQHKKDDDTWHSTPFYSGPQGYKMCLRVYANGLVVMQALM